MLQGNSNFSMSSKAVLDSLLGEGGICKCGNVGKRPHAFLGMIICSYVT